MPILPAARITVFSDYICPFCYVGNARINRLKNEFDIKINWRLVEIHPETPDSGNDVSKLQYDTETWAKMMRGLDRLLEEEQLEMRAISFIANSHYALRLAEEAKTEGATIFYALHDALFRAYFVDGINIGDKQVLTDIATDNGVSEATLTRALDDEQYNQFLGNNVRIAKESNITGVPSLLIGDNVLHGISTTGSIREALLANTSTAE